METEIKALINEKDYIRLITEASHQKEIQVVIKIDSYYKKEQKLFDQNSPIELDNKHYRIRKIISDKGSIIEYTVKEKHVDDKGLECNDERTSYMSDASGVEDLLYKAGFENYFTKLKTSIGLNAVLKEGDSNYHIEIEEVKNVKTGKAVYAVEIENVGDTEKEKDFHYNNECKLLEGMGVSKDSIESRDWYTLLIGE